MNEQTKYLSVLIAIAFLLSACGAATATPVLSPTDSLTPTRTLTPTASITPLPIIATFTPTFDVRTIVTVTPATAAVCPDVNPDLTPDGSYQDATQDATLQYLNAGGSLDKLWQKQWGIIEDLTGDGVEEVAWSDRGYVYIDGCKEGKFIELMRFEGIQGHTPQIDINDLNRNGIPEIIITDFERYAFRTVHIYEWNGTEFIPRIKIAMDNNSVDWVGGTGFKLVIADINNDGLQEIIAVDRIPANIFILARGVPWRERTITLGWNGENFIIISDEYSPPRYRFQAIQDGDTYVLNGQYEKALSSYQNAIFNDNLDWWSKERREYEKNHSFNSYFDNMSREFVIALTETPTPYPTLPAVTPDLTERPRLAAYAYYRMIALHVYLGEMDAATVKYNTLQTKFPAGDPGHPYVEMATAFWDAYQSSGNMTAACGAAIQYAAEHPEILEPLGSWYHGFQSHQYIPADVCPFR